MEAIILAGGRGTRLQTAVPDLPKPLAPIGGRPFLALLLDYLERQGFRQVHLSIGYRKEEIIAAIGQRHGKLRLHYITEELPLGTGGALRNALSEATGSPVFTLNGDTFFALDYPAMLAQHCETGARLTMALRHVPDTARYGRVEVENTQVISFREKGEGGEGWINGGIYLLDQNLFDGYELPTSFAFEQEFLQRYQEQIALQAYLSNSYFIDIGIPEDYLRAQQEIPLFLESA